MKNFYFNITIMFTIVFTAVLGIDILRNSHSIPIVKYFPLDEDVFFEEAFTSLQLTDSSTPYCFLWQNRSSTNIPLYLRQDINLLFMNSILIGAKNKWQENTAEILTEENLCFDQESVIQGLSFSYGENHQNEKITSIYQMSEDELFVRKTEEGKFNSVIDKENNNGQALPLKEKINQVILKRQKELINHFDINKENYIIMTLFQMKKAYDANNLPVPEEIVDRVIGQLWEGLYRNYVLPVLENEVYATMPLILFSKDESHLLVVFYMKDEPQLLIQQYFSQ